MTVANGLIDESVMDKIQKLLALSTSSNENEAALAAAKAQDLLLRFNLDRADVEKRGHKASSLRKIEGQNVNLMHKKGSTNLGWERLLAAAIAKYNFCRVGFYHGWPMVYVVGEKQNIEVVEYLLNYLEREVDRLAQTEYWGRKAQGLIPQGTRGQNWTASFSLGCVATIARRLKDNWELQQARNNDVTALIVVNDKALSEFYEKEVTGKGNVNVGRNSDNSAYFAGRKAGEKVALNQGIRSGDGDAPKQIN